MKKPTNHPALALRIATMKNGARLVGLAVPAALALAPAQLRAEEGESPVPAAPAAEKGVVATTPAPAYDGLLGDWGGLKPTLHDKGVDLSLGFGSQSAYNADGGLRHRFRTATQFAFGADFDLDRIIGLEGGSFHVTITRRDGLKLEDSAGFQTLQQVQEVYGRGNIFRLTNAYYQQKIGKFDLKLGRFPTGSDSDSFACDFQNLGFCGSQPGNIVGDYWYNWPIGQWGARLRYNVSSDFSVQAAAYLINTRNIEPAHGFAIDDPFDAKGTLVPVEAVWTPKFGPSALAGSYTLGVWYTSFNGADLRPDANGAFGVRKNRYGGYFSFVQEVLHTGEGRNVSVFLRGAKADSRTAQQDGALSAGVVWKGISSGRPNDWIGAAYGISWLSGDYLNSGVPGSAGRSVERYSELFYNLSVARWLWLRPNVQYVDQPGGFRNAPDAVVLGLKTGLTF